MHKQTHPFAFSLAMTLAILQIILCVLPTVSITDVRESDEYCSYSTTNTSPFSALESMCWIVTERDDAETEELELEEYYREHYGSSYDYDEYDYDDYEDSDEPSTGSIYASMIFLLAILTLSVYFFVYGSKSTDSARTYHLYLSLSSLSFVAFSFFTVAICDSFASESLSENHHTNIGFTIFGIISIIAMIVQWILFFAQKDNTYAASTFAAPAPAAAPPAPPASPHGTLGYDPFAAPAPTPQPMQSRVKNSTVSVPKPKPSQTGETCSVCGANIPPACRFCCSCGADLQQQSKNP